MPSKYGVRTQRPNPEENHRPNSTSSSSASQVR